MNTKRREQISEELEVYMARCGIGGDITPEQKMKWDNLVAEMDNLIGEIEENNNQPKTIDLPICYVDLIEDCLETIQKHNLLELVYGYTPDKDEVEAREADLQTVLDNFCRPLTVRDADVTINVMD